MQICEALEHRVDSAPHANYALALVQFDLGALALLVLDSAEDFAALLIDQTQAVKQQV